MIGKRLGLGACAWALLAGASHAESLSEAIAAAYQNNPTVQAQRAQLRALDETYVQARAGLRPQVSVEAGGSRQTVDQFVSTDSNYGLTVSQPLFTGGRVTAQVGAAKAEILAGRETLRQGEIGLMLSVIRAYADVQRDQQAFEIREKSLEDLAAEVQAMQSRFAAGDVTRTDVAQSQTSQAAARALVALGQQQLAISVAIYAAIVGDPPGRLDPEPALPGMVATIDQALTAGDSQSPAVRAALFTEQASRRRIDEAKAELAPQVGLRATYGFANDRSNYQPDIFGRSLTASATFSQPIFTGGVLNSRIRQARERHTADLFQIDQARRQMKLQVVRAWSQISASKNALLAIEDQTRAAREAYEGMDAERKAGQRTTLEVLSAEQARHQAELDLVNARHDMFVAQAELLASAGLLDIAELTGGAAVYDPNLSFAKVSKKGALPTDVIVQAIDNLAAKSLERLPPSTAARPQEPNPH